MVLNRQRMREEDDRRRDVAMHAKLDELLRAEKFARKELAGIEELESEEIAALKLKLKAATSDGRARSRRRSRPPPGKPPLSGKDGPAT